MPKHWGGNYFTHGSFPEVGQKQKTERKKEEEKKRRERLNDGNNNGQATHGARKQGCQVWGGWGGPLPHPGVVPPNEDLSPPPIPKILSPPPR